MSKQAVTDLIHRLLTDEELRIRFTVDRFDAIADVCLGGLELTSDEMNVFITSDARMWFEERQMHCPLH